MKKSLCVFLIFVLVFLLTSCGYNVEKEGTDKIRVAESEKGISRLLPKDKDGKYSYNNFVDFNEQFQSVDENAFYKFINNSPMGKSEIVLVYFKYPEDIFESVKEYVMSDMGFSSDDYIFKNEKYTFYEMKESESGFLSWKEMIFAFSDETQTIVLMGSYFEGADWAKSKLAYPYFEKYLLLFSEYFDFSKQ